MSTRNLKSSQSSFSTNTIATSTTPSASAVVEKTNFKPPRPMNCFLLYRHEKQKEILARCPGANHRDLSKIIAKWWRQATAEEKEPYIKKAALEKIKHAHQYPSYKFMPQKKSKDGTRTYKRRTQDEFTSKSKELNDCMKVMYHACDDSTPVPIVNDSKPAKPVTTTTTVSTSASIPTINVNMVASSLLLPSSNNSHLCIMNMSSPSSSSLSLSSTSSSPSSLSSPYYHPYAYSETDIYYQQDPLSIATSFLLKDNTSPDCAFYATSGRQNIDNGYHNDQMQMDTFSLNQPYNSDPTNLYVPDDYFCQPPKQQRQQSEPSFFDTTPLSCSSIYPDYFPNDYTTYSDLQDYQQSLSPSDFYMNPTITGQDLTFAAACSPNSLL